MSWTRLDDLWTDQPLFADLDFSDRWHYLAMIQFCSRTGQYDGVLRATDARRCSDHPEPAQALANLADLGLIVPAGKGYRLVKIDEHIPPPSVRESTERAKLRKRRERAHKNGDHSTCLPEHCEKVTGEVTRDKQRDKPEGGTVTGDVTRDTGTGQDGTGQAFTNEVSDSNDSEAVWPPVAVPPVQSVAHEVEATNWTAPDVPAAAEAVEDPNRCRVCGVGLTEWLRDNGNGYCGEHWALGA